MSCIRLIYHTVHPADLGQACRYAHHSWETVVPRATLRGLSKCFSVRCIILVIHSESRYLPRKVAGDQQKCGQATSLSQVGSYPFGYRMSGFERPKNARTKESARTCPGRIGTARTCPGLRPSSRLGAVPERCGPCPVRLVPKSRI